MRLAWFSLARLSWVLPLSWASIALLISLMVNYYSSFPLLALLVLAGLSGLCFVFACVGLKSEHKASAIAGFVLNLPVILGVLWVFNNMSFATKL